MEAEWILPHLGGWALKHAPRSAPASPGLRTGSHDSEPVINASDCEKPFHPFTEKYSW